VVKLLEFAMNGEEALTQAFNLDDVSSTKHAEGIRTGSLASRPIDSTDQEIVAPPPDGGLHAWLQVLMVSPNHFQI
jgi:hypothetical protein